MTTPPDSGQNPSMWQGILAAIAAAFLTLSAHLMRRSGKAPRPSGFATRDEIQSIMMALEGLKNADEALDRKMDRHSAILEDHGRRLNRIEVRSEAASA